MSTPSPVTKAAAPPTPIPLSERVKRIVTPYLAPYYLTVAAALGAATVGFVVVIALLILVATNFNILGFIE
jgi:hypothetical protein